MVIGCGAVGLSAVQGARLAGAGTIIAVDLDPGEARSSPRRWARRTASMRPMTTPSLRKTRNRRPGVDVVIEAAGSASAFRVTTEAVRPGGQVIWLGKIDVNRRCRFAGAA